MLEGWHFLLHPIDIAPTLLSCLKPLFGEKRENGWKEVGRREDRERKRKRGRSTQVRTKKHLGAGRRMHPKAT